MPIGLDEPYRVIHNDHLGTPMIMTDSAGSVVWQGEFKPFGEPMTVTGSITNKLRFPGQYYDSETGLHQNWHRDYKPEIGRYVSGDRVNLASLQLPLPLFDKMPVYLYSIDEKTFKKFLFRYSRYYPSTLNRYVFVYDNPMSYIDPTGDFGWDTIGRLIAKQIGKWFSKKIMPDKGLNLPDEGDDDNDGTMNFMDPDSEYCIVNCTKGGGEEGQCVLPEGPSGDSGDK